MAEISVFTVDDLKHAEVNKRAVAANLRLRLVREELKRQLQLKNDLFVKDGLLLQLISDHTDGATDAITASTIDTMDTTAMMAENVTACQAAVTRLEVELASLSPPRSDFLVEATTSMAKLAATKGTVHVSFLCGDTWSDRQEFFHGTEKGATETKGFQVAAAMNAQPSHIRFTTDDKDAWGYWKIVVNGAVVLEDPHGETGTPASETKKRRSFDAGANIDEYWIANDGSCTADSDYPLENDGTAAVRVALQQHLELSQEQLRLEQRMQTELLSRQLLTEKLIAAHDAVAEDEMSAATALLHEHVAFMEEAMSSLSGGLEGSGLTAHLHGSDNADGMVGLTSATSAANTLSSEERSRTINSLRVLDSSSRREMFARHRSAIESITTDQLTKICDNDLRVQEARVKLCEAELRRHENSTLSHEEINKLTVAQRLRLQLAKDELLRQQKLKPDVLIRHRFAQQLIDAQCNSETPQRTGDGTTALSAEIQRQHLHIKVEMPEQQATSDGKEIDCAEFEVISLEQQLKDGASDLDTADIERQLLAARLRLRLARDRAKRSRLQQLQAQLRDQSVQKMVAANKLREVASEEVDVLNEMLDNAEQIADAHTQEIAAAADVKELEIDAANDASVSTNNDATKRRLVAAQLKLKQARAHANAHRRKQTEAKLRLRQVALLKASVDPEYVVEDEAEDAAAADNAPQDVVGVVDAGYAVDADNKVKTNNVAVDIEKIQARAKAAKIRQKIATDRANREAEIQRQLRMQVRMADNLVKTSYAASKFESDKMALDASLSHLNKELAAANAEGLDSTTLQVQVEAVANSLQAVAEQASQCAEHTAEIELQMEPMISNVKTLIDTEGEKKNEDDERQAVAAMVVMMEKAEKTILELAPVQRQKHAKIAAGLTAALALSRSVPAKTATVTRASIVLTDNTFDEAVQIIQESVDRMPSDPVRQEAALPKPTSPTPANADQRKPAPPETIPSMFRDKTATKMNRVLLNTRLVRKVKVEYESIVKHKAANEYSHHSDPDGKSALGRKGHPGNGMPRRSSMLAGKRGAPSRVGKPRRSSKIL